MEPQRRVLDFLRLPHQLNYCTWSWRHLQQQGNQLRSPDIGEAFMHLLLNSKVVIKLPPVSQPDRRFFFGSDGRLCLVQRPTEEARTCEAWFQLTFRSQKWNLKAHMWYQLSLFPSSNVAICDAAPPRQHSPILRYSALLRYSVLCFNSLSHIFS